MVATSLLATDFQEFTGGVKDTDACEHRFALVSFLLLSIYPLLVIYQMKKQYEAVVTLKNASDFIYSNNDSANISLKQCDIWNRYVKVCVQCHLNLDEMIP